VARRDGSLSGRAHRVARPVMISEPRSSPVPAPPAGVISGLDRVALGVS